MANLPSSYKKSDAIQIEVSDVVRHEATPDLITCKIESLHVPEPGTKVWARQRLDWCNKLGDYVLCAMKVVVDRYRWELEILDHRSFALAIGHQDLLVPVERWGGHEFPTEEDKTERDQAEVERQKFYKNVPPWVPPPPYTKAQKLWTNVWPRLRYWRFYLLQPTRDYIQHKTNQLVRKPFKSLARRWLGLAYNDTCEECGSELSRVCTAHGSLAHSELFCLNCAPYFKHRDQSENEAEPHPTAEDYKGVFSA